MKTGSVNISNFNNVELRLDASFHLSQGVSARRLISSSPYEILKISEVSEKCYIGNRAKRIYVTSKTKGVPFLSSSDILQSDLENVKYVSKKYTPQLNEMRLNCGWTLITRSGTIGNTAFSSHRHENKLASEHVIRLIPNGRIKEGMLYCYLSSKYGYSLLTQGTFGGVIQHIEPAFVESLPFPNFPLDFQIKVDNLIQEATKLRDQAACILTETDVFLHNALELENLKIEDFDYYGPKQSTRRVSCFTVKRKDINTTTINAFNWSERIRKTKKRIRHYVPLSSILLDNSFFSTGSFPRVQVSKEKGIMLINQSDIFNQEIKGKYISKKNLKATNLVEYGEVLVAGVGTLGENEKFCRVVFANEDLVGQLVSGEFMRMKTKDVPSGYLYAWLNSDYGFRLIRSTQAGTKLCRPIPKLFLELPIPIMPEESMSYIDHKIREAHSSFYKANTLEQEAISLVEKEIESWRKNNYSK